MKPLVRYLVWTFGSVAYWTVALIVVLFLSYALPGDCGTERTEAGLSACAREVRLIVMGGLVVAGAAYALAVRAIRRRV